MARLAWILLLFLLLIAGGGRVGAAELTYPVEGNFRPDAITYEIWFRLEQDPATYDQRKFDLGLIRWPGRNLPFTQFVYQTYWTTNDYHVCHRMGGSMMGTPTDGLLFASLEDTEAPPKSFEGIRHARLRRGDWHYAAWTAKGFSQPLVTVYLDGKTVVPERQVLLAPWISIGAATLHFSHTPVTLDELRISSVVRASAEIAASFQKGALVRDEHTLLLDHFDRVDKSADGTFTETIAECIAGYQGEKGGCLKENTYDLVEGKFGRALQLVAPAKKP